MAKDGRDILEVLQGELDFIEKGGYGRSVRTPWLPKSIFQDSLSCLNYGGKATNAQSNIEIARITVPARFTNRPARSIIACATFAKCGIR